MTYALPTRESLIGFSDLLFVLTDLLRDPQQIELATAAQVREIVGCASLNDGTLPAAIYTLIADAHSTPREPWQQEYHRLFEGSMLCPINEAAYVRRDKGQLLGDISGFYRAFGFDLAAGNGERLDHLRCELEFVAVLLVMLGQAQERRAEDDQEVTLGALRSFASEHLCVWIEAFCIQLSSSTTFRVYSSLSAVTSRLIKDITASLGVVASSSVVGSPAPDDEDDGSTMKCGAAHGSAALPCDITVEGNQRSTV